MLEPPDPPAPPDDSSESNGNHDHEGPLGGQYLDVLARLQQLVRITIEWWEQKVRHQDMSLTRSDIHSLLDAALTDLHVWTNELSDDPAFFLENLGSLKSRNHALNANLQQRLSKIGLLLTSIGEELNDDTFSFEFVYFS